MPELEKLFFQSCVKNSTRKVVDLQNKYNCLQLINRISFQVRKDNSQKVTLTFGFMMKPKCLEQIIS